MTGKHRVTFLHPDLGIGGAERLVVDAAVALKAKGHEVQFVTSHHDPKHCFSETRDGQFQVTVVGDWLPRHICGRFFALCAYIRMMWAALYIILQKDRPEIVFCDLVSACIPILKLRIPLVVFYCHHPDQLLTTYESQLKKIYRAPINYLEEITTGMADKVFVNSLYTKSVYENTFKRLNAEDTEVLYPSISTDFFDEVLLSDNVLPMERILEKKFPLDTCFLLSINRYERKKRLSSAIEALASLKKIDPDSFKKVCLIMAGGYERRVKENREYFEELEELASELDVRNKICFLRSPTDTEKVSLLFNCDVLIYTPPNEHFGIVPLEAMYAAKPVIAHNSGGPKESVIHEETGYLVEESEFAEKVSVLLKSKELRVKLGDAGKNRFQKEFSFQAFTSKLDSKICNMYKDKKS
ncbi:hypothetical protein QAD02_004653 [Eretmocerus hayati]|uniref:Uncharacterized protein n=1 Tax=Eretmocerus hayati TaxID=131215 RepID=A0ACC2NS09_9HYME|nr:hypothetical protein QAD02_004653 [Eretmocerus hayati]